MKGMKLMNTVKTFIKYIIWIILFWILSDFLINVGLKSTYKEMQKYSGKWLVFFSHPGDFTPVCTTEMIAFARAYPFFQKLNTNLLGLSIDSNASHLAWVNEIYNLTGVSLPFPIIADRNGSIARLYGMISNDVSTTKTVRNVFIIDGNGMVLFVLFLHIL